MSEKRYELIERFIAYGSGKPQFTGYSIKSEGKSHDIVEACDLLNSQAETIEVLREWVDCLDDDGDIIRERAIIRGLEPASPARVELANRRIAALEGK